MVECGSLLNCCRSKILSGVQIPFAPYSLPDRIKVVTSAFGADCRGSSPLPGTINNSRRLNLYAHNSPHLICVARE